MINSGVDVTCYVFTEENINSITEAAAATTNAALREAERVMHEQHQINFIISGSLFKSLNSPTGSLRILC